jgi:hypothetical protein
MDNGQENERKLLISFLPGRKVLRPYLVSITLIWCVAAFIRYYPARTRKVRGYDRLRAPAMLLPYFTSQGRMSALLDESFLSK